MELIRFGFPCASTHHLPPHTHTHTCIWCWLAGREFLRMQKWKVKVVVAELGGGGMALWNGIMDVGAQLALY